MANHAELFGNVYAKGQVVFGEGDQADRMFIIQSGAVEVSRLKKGRKVVLTLLEKGDFFGEMALLDDAPRSATVTTITRTRLLPLTRRSFLEGIAYNPDTVLQLLKSISRRIDRMTGQVREMVAADKTLRRLIRSKGTDSNGSDASKDGDLDGGHRPESGRSNKRIFRKKSSPHDFWSVLKNGGTPPAHFESGSTLFEYGDSGDYLYFIIEGTVEIYQSDHGTDRTIALLGPGDVFGEMALVSGDPRTASARTLTPAVLCRLNRADMMAGIRSDPATALFFLQVLINRLRIITDALEDPLHALTTLRQAFLPPVKKIAKMTVGISSLSSCGGCATVLLGDPDELAHISTKIEVRYCPMFTDQDQVTEVDLAIVDGAVRTREDVVQLFDIRRKSRLLAAWGACAVFGGLPNLANDYELEDLMTASYGETLDPFAYYLSGKPFDSASVDTTLHEHLLRKTCRVSDIVKVDYHLPGCPPPSQLFSELLNELTEHSAPPVGRQVVCASCARKFKRGSFSDVRLFPRRHLPAGECFLSHHVLCMGFLIRGGCSAVCPGGGLPCWGCRGPADKVIARLNEGERLEEVMIDALARRWKQTPDTIKTAVRRWRVRTGNALNFGNHFIKDVSRIR